MKKSYFYTLSLLVSLSIIIIFFGKVFDKNIEKAALRNNGIYDLEEWKIDNGRYSISVPKGWSIEEDIEVNKINIYISDQKTINITLTYLKDKSNYNNNLLDEVKDKTYKEYIKNINSLEWKVLIYELNEDKVVRYYYKDFENGMLIYRIEYIKSEQKESIEKVFEAIVGGFKHL